MSRPATTPCLHISLLLTGMLAGAGAQESPSESKEDNSPSLEHVELELAPDVTMKLVKVPAGKFLMGSDPDEPFRVRDGREELLLVRADRTKYQLMARLRLFDDQQTEVWSHPALVQGRLYVRHESSINCLVLP